LAWAVGLVQAQSPTVEPPKRDPLSTGTHEDVEVRLVLIDTVVVDRDGRTVPDLTASDFEIFVDGVRRPIDTLDLSCPTGAADDVRGGGHPKRRAALPSPDVGRQIGIAMDYQHMSQTDVFDVLTRAREIVKHTASANDKIMVAALTGGLRVEQAFSSDHAQVLRSLKRMQYDISLWNRNYRHSHEGSFFSGLEALLQVVSAVEGPKAMVLFSNSPAPADEDLRFARIAALASSSRCSIYSIHAAGLGSAPG